MRRDEDERERERERERESARAQTYLAWCVFALTRWRLLFSMSYEVGLPMGSSVRVVCEGTRVCAIPVSHSAISPRDCDGASKYS